MASKENFYLTVLDLFKQGLNPSKISKKLNISKQKLNYYIRKLKKNGYIEKKGYGTWEVKTFSLSQINLKQLKVRGHAFVWKVKIHKNFNWEEILKGKNFKLVGKEKYPRIIIKDKKVWLGKNRIIIFENKSFYSNNAINSKKLAVFSLLEVLRALESKLSINLRPYAFSLSREHYGLIKNELARQCNKKGEKIHIRDDIDGEWLWIDDSESLNELETNKVGNNLGVQNWWNDMKKNKFQVTPSYTLNSINQVTQNQMMFAQNFETHVEAIKTLSEKVKELSEVIKELKNAKNN
jgi:DNA-binding IscR family transcriptional regulator